MSFTNGEYVINPDIVSYIAEHDTATWDDVFQEVILPAFQAWVSQCDYVVINNRPCIKLPWADGNVGASAFIVWYVDDTYTQIAKNRNVNFKVGTCETGSYSINVLANNRTVYKEGSNHNYAGDSFGYPYQSNPYFRIHVEDGAYHIGIKGISGAQTVTNISCPYHVGKFKKVDGTYTDFIFNAQPRSSSSSGNILCFIMCLRDGNTQSLIYIYIPCVLPGTRANVAQVSKLDIGDMSHDKWFVYSQFNSSMSGEWVTNATTLVDSVTAGKVWFENAFTLDGQAFDAFIGDGGINQNIFCPCLCRKHE